MQGHPESPQLWEKYANAILCNVGLTPTVHKLCLHLDIIAGKRVIFKQQVNDFAMAAPNEHIANIFFHVIDVEFQIPMKRHEYLGMYNGVDVKQTKNYIKISCKSFIEKMCSKNLNSWMQNFTSTNDCPTPLPTDPKWYTQFNAAVGNPDPKVQSKLAKAMQILYHCGVGELIWAMTTT